MAIVEIGDLPSTALPNMLHELAAQKDGLTVKLRVNQIYDLILAQLVVGAPTTLDTLNELAAALGDDPNFAVTMTNALALKAALTQVVRYDAAQSLTQPQKAQARSNMGASQDQKMRNRIVNPAMAISQENSVAAGTTNVYFMSDQWRSNQVTSGAVLSWKSESLITPNKSPIRLKCTVTTADGTIAAGDSAAFLQFIEGTKVVDFAFGTASARQAILRFGWRSPAGTYCVAVRNAALNRTYLKTFTVTAPQANTDVEFILLIPGDTTGTWPGFTSTNAWYLDFNFMAGTSSQGTNNAWQAGSFASVAGCTNGVATINSEYHLFDVGLYLDIDGTGIPPKWEFPHYADELRECQRYYQILTSVVVETTALAQSITFPTEMRAVPTVSGGGAGFTANSLSTTTAQFTQTTRAYQTIALNAR